jgi:hypothetical protein
VQSGLVARSSKVTQSEGLLVATRRAGPFWPPFDCLPAAVAQDKIAASLVGPYTVAWLPPYSLHSAKIGSVKAVQTNGIPL